MYIPKLYREEDHRRVLEFLHRNDFATLVAYDGQRPVASHLLMEVVQDGGRLFVNGHMSRANPLWRLLEQNPEVLAIFQGPHTYISATWYNHVNVPTWNYQAVHVYGKPGIVTDRQVVYDILKRLVDRYEAHGSYRLEKLPHDFVEKEMNGVVAFQIDVSRIEANYKLSQNRSDEDHRSIVEHLEQRTDELSHHVAKAMRQNRPRR